VTLPIMHKALRSVNVADGTRGLRVQARNTVMRWRLVKLKFLCLTMPNLMLVKI
jgi:hypothetical protein